MHKLLIFILLASLLSCSSKQGKSGWCEVVGETIAEAIDTHTFGALDSALLEHIEFRREKLKSMVIAVQLHKYKEDFSEDELSLLRKLLINAPKEVSCEFSGELVFRTNKIIEGKGSETKVIVE